ncbi:hypothetical protein PHYSODRAFT_315416 [Phytophthora sojae]|uniref:Integrase zinc-binding domain-containing protein n=1 Tax=Phytophthora sojae (strain P6497) TaxID=1094619 RepID=G4ZD14_PHYSP|nr:hypothetical protein PHYSODRAFT_315416 [Phytophthora sojae]EGZ18962.1 hypothetical protein PHYSODRAFT_315416 [Phytophthora sojae]|eukprot:XP_009528020.1 hypothetical protein PHYSODRAFT_315416 [Phytophthora sojae]
MLESMRHVLTWPGMTVDVPNWVRNCTECAQTKVDRNKYGKLPTKTVEARPWAEVAVGSIGPFGPKKWRALTMIDTSTRLLEMAAMENGDTSGVVERVHRTINNKLRAERIDTFSEWENCLSAHHTAIGMTPGQATFGRDVLFDVPMEVDWQQQQEKRDAQSVRASKRENESRLEHDYAPDELVMVARGDKRYSQLRILHLEEVRNIKQK